MPTLDVLLQENRIELIMQLNIFQWLKLLKYFSIA